MKLESLLFAIAIFGYASSVATAGVSLLSVSSPVNVSGFTGQTESSMALGLHYVSPGVFGSSIISHLLFSGVTIRMGDQGSSIISNSSRDAEFVGFVTLLTNGTPEVIQGNATPGNIYFDPSGAGMPERNFFTPPEGSDEVDFKGFTIDRIDFFVTTFTISSEPSEFSESGIFTGYNLAGIFRIYGEKTEIVPEPSSCGLAIFGTATLLIRRRRWPLEFAG